MTKYIVLGQDVAVRHFMSERVGTAVSSDGVSIGLAEGGHLIAGVMFDQYNGASICMHVAGVDGGRWLTREYLRVCFAYPFVQLRVNKIIGLVSSANLAARRFDEHIGFRLEATLKDAHLDGDLLVYSMTRAGCRWLNMPLKVAQHGKELCTPCT